MIEKILDKYFAKKACLLLKQKLLLYRINVKIKKELNRYNVYIKNLKEKDIYYKFFISINFDEGFERYNAILQEDLKSIYESVKHIV